ncbi:MAG TPA: fasciclin domain-containing protein [Bacteroidales bacterium]|nr:fasciclin domain-containing protein [Bacteroidales bacterium]
MKNPVAPVLRFSLLISAFLFNSCEKKFDEYYQVPDDLIGTILEVLEEDGNYTQFIRAVELVEYDDVIGVTGNFTVFAPDDNAFAEFFTEYGYASLEDIPEELLEGIVYYHIVFWAYSKFMLLYGLGIQDEDIDYNTFNFKQITKYTPPKTLEFDTLGQRYTVYHESKFIPVYSDEFFIEQDLNAAANYSFLYPGTPYGGFHVDRAEVVEADVPAQNGWIHKINKVLVPPDNHDKILEKRPEFSLFRELLEINTFYQYSQTYTTQQDNEGDVDEDGDLDSLFLKMNSIFPSGSSPDAENVGYNGKQNVLTLFAPTNDALLSFLNDYTVGYSSLFQIGRYWMNWYLSHYIGANYWPSEFNSLTDDWELDLTSLLVNCNVTEADIHYAQMASNGPFCGINKFFLPKIFESIAQPIFGNKEYEWFCDMLVYYQVESLLNEEDLEFTLFAPTNAAIDKAGYIFRTGLGGWGLYSKSNPLAPLPRREASDIVKTHLVFGQLAESDFVEGSFIETSQHTYIGMTQDGIYAGGDLTPAKMGSPEIVSGKGVLYNIDRMMISPKYSIFEILSNPNIYPQYQKFYQLCYQSGLILLDKDMNPLSLNNISVGTYYTCFIPTNEALTEGLAYGTVPTDPVSLQQFLRYHFVEGVIFSDGEKSGEFNTTRIDEESGYLFNTIEIMNQQNDINIKDNLGNIRNVISANHMAEDGVIHQIDSVLLFK